LTKLKKFVPPSEVPVISSKQMTVNLNKIESVLGSGRLKVVFAFEKNSPQISSLSQVETQWKKTLGKR